MPYKRIDRLFLRLWLIVIVLAVYQVHGQYKKFFPEMVFSHHVIGVTYPMITSVTSKDQLAAVIAHEISHITLGHTVQNKHHITMEYNADLLSIYYLRKGGFGLCGAHELWEASKGNYTDLSPATHPNYMTRAYYMDMPECKDKPKTKEVLTIQDAADIYKRLSKFVAGNARYTTRFEIFYFTNSRNAYAGTRYKEKR